MLFLNLEAAFFDKDFNFSWRVLICLYLFRRLYLVLWKLELHFNKIFSFFSSIFISWLHVFRLCFEFQLLSCIWTGLWCTLRFLIMPVFTWLQHARGETLSSISKLYGVPILEIAASNEELADVNLVFEGQSLKIPSVAESAQLVSRIILCSFLIFLFPFTSIWWFSIVS